MFKRIFTILLVFLLSNSLVYAKGISLTTGFISNDYGTSYYYDTDKFYNDGWELIDDNNDGMYEYYYFSPTGHYLISSIAPNGYILSESGKLIIDNVVYSISAVDAMQGALFSNKFESADERKLALKADCAYVFGKWYVDSSNDINAKLDAISNNLSINKVNSIKDDISKHTKDLKKILSWYEDRLNQTKKLGTIDKSLYNELRKQESDDMTIWNNKFREEMNNRIKAMGY